MIDAHDYYTRTGGDIVPKVFTGPATIEITAALTVDCKEASAFEDIQEAWKRLEDFARSTLPKLGYDILEITPLKDET